MYVSILSFKIRIDKRRKATSFFMSNIFITFDIGNICARLTLPRPYFMSEIFGEFICLLLYIIIIINKLTLSRCAANFVVGIGYGAA